MNHTVPTPDPIVPGAIRIADADREQVAERIRAAATEGRLTLGESDERQALAYAALTSDDLRPLVADLPAPVHVPDRSLTDAARRRLTIHAAIVGVLAVVMIVGAILGAVFGGPGPFIPVFPLFWLGLSAFVHYRIAQRRSAEERRRTQPAPAY